MQLSMVIAALALALAAAVQTLTGAGFALTAAPPLLLVAPALVPDALLWLTLLVTGYTVTMDRTVIDRVFVRRCVLAAVPGTGVGFAATAMLPGQALTVGIAIAVVVAGCVGLAGRRPPITPATTCAAGLAAGALNWVAALPGPPVALVYRAADAATIRATLSALFLCVSAVTLAARYASGQAHAGAGVAAVGLALAVLGGAVLARPLTRRISSALVSRGALVLSTLAGVVLLIRTVR